MKKISYLVSVLCMCLAFAACSEDTDRTFYYPTNTEATFAAKTGSYSFGKDDPAEYSITVSRVNTNGNANVEITNNGAEGIFNIPSSIEFVDGENEAIINISFNRSNMEVGKVYPVTIDLPTHRISGKQTSFSLNVTRDYVWEHFATGNLAGFLVGGERSLYRRADNSDFFKLPNFYAQGYDIIFELKDGVITMSGNLDSDGYYSFESGIIHPSYGMVSISLNPDSQSSNVDFENKKITLSNFYFVVGVGSFGWKKDVFSW